MLIAVEYVVDEAIDDGGLAYCLVAQEDNFIFEQGRDRTLGQIQVADVRHICFLNNRNTL